MGCLIDYLLFYDLHLCITLLVTIYYIYTPPARFGVFALNCMLPFHWHHAKLTFCIIGKDLYPFTFVLPTPLFYSPCFCVYSPCPFWPPLHIRYDMTSLKPIPFHSNSFPSHLSFPPLKKMISQNHIHPSQRRDVLVPTVLLPVWIIPEPLKVQSGTEAVLFLWIRPPSDDLPYVCHNLLSKLEF